MCSCAVVGYAGSDNAEADTCGLSADTACVICFEREGDHVLVPCGHGGYCHKCAHTLHTHPAASRLCPICRAGLSAVVKVPLDTPVGSATDVLQATSAASAPRPPTRLASLAPPRSASLPEAASSLPGPIFVSLPPPLRRQSHEEAPVRVTAAAAISTGMVISFQNVPGSSSSAVMRMVAPPTALNGSDAVDELTSESLSDAFSNTVSQSSVQASALHAPEDQREASNLDCGIGVQAEAPQQNLEAPVGTAVSISATSGAVS